MLGLPEIDLFRGQCKTRFLQQVWRNAVKYLAESGAHSIYGWGAKEFGEYTSSPRAHHSRKQYHPYWRAITANMQMRVKKKKSNNLNSKRKKWSVGKTTEKKEFFKLQYTHSIIKTSGVRESLCEIFLFCYDNREIRLWPTLWTNHSLLNSVDNGPAPLPFST